ncbi:hypothetical protein ANN_22935 [Periplaneta americana]|uniref:Uncharacterized protein n=1 Tax=Periplaneta americana TaxID=6978 RepID=A0ABQ8SKT3_PERAM|nr:hypothetical protein ANN_22935 [Periplaneta americana]
MPSTWPGIEPATLGIKGQRYTNSPTNTTALSNSKQSQFVEHGTRVAISCAHVPDMASKFVFTRSTSLYLLLEPLQFPNKLFCDCDNAVRLKVTLYLDIIKTILICCEWEEVPSTVELESEAPLQWPHLNAIDLARDRTRNPGHKRPALYQLANQVDRSGNVRVESYKQK